MVADNSPISSKIFNVVDEEEAHKTLKILDEIGELSATMEDLDQGSR
jgi:hydrogenase maturation factor